MTSLRSCRSTRCKYRRITGDTGSRHPGAVSLSVSRGPMEDEEPQATSALIRIWLSLTRVPEQRRKGQVRRSELFTVAAAYCCRKITKARLRDRNRALTWVGDTGIEPVTSSV